MGLPKRLTEILRFLLLDGVRGSSNGPVSLGLIGENSKLELQLKDEV